MDVSKLRAWWSSKQGLDGSLAAGTPEQALETAGWSRSVGGANPYLALWARCGTARAAVDASVSDFRLHELPSARGCTYVLPRLHFALGLSVGQGFGEDAAITTAVRFLGVTQEEVAALQVLVVEALRQGPMDPRALKSALGSAVRNLGDEGKKRGITTTLPLALGKLQSLGEIRRIPVNGRIDNQRYAYALWPDGALTEAVCSRELAAKQLADLYFRWIGPARPKDFQWFTGLGVKASQEAMSGLDLVEIGEGLLLLREEVESFRSFERSPEPRYVLTGSLDNLSHLRAGLPDLVGQDDSDVQVVTERTTTALGSVTDLMSHAIYDRGRLVGVWEFDPEAGEIVWQAWHGDRDAIRAKVVETEVFVRDQLGDARIFSLDSPASRKPRLERLRALSRA